MKINTALLLLFKSVVWRLLPFLHAVVNFNYFMLFL
jgi:hypothetical protein